MLTAAAAVKAVVIMEVQVPVSYTRARGRESERGCPSWCAQMSVFT